MIQRTTLYVDKFILKQSYFLTHSNVQCLQFEQNRLEQWSKEVKCMQVSFIENNWMVPRISFGLELV